MKTVALAFLVCFLVCCQAKSPHSELDSKEVLSKPLNEISGIVADGNELWAITDKPKAVIYKLSPEGKLLQEVSVTNAKATDVEAITNDEKYFYIGDLGDNEGDREERQVIRVSKASIGKDKEAEVTSEIISFRFSEDVMVDKKKKNNYDCESILSFGDSLYLFTKRRTDMQTELFSLPKTPGNYIASSLGTFDSKGLVTDAAINRQNNEVALTGYNKGHKYPFILLFKDFKGNNFLTGNIQRIELADKPWDWQIESIAFNNNGEVYFACEETKEVQSTLYAIKREKLSALNKKR